MAVSIFGQPVWHRAVRSEPDPRIAVTTCGIRFHWDPMGHHYAQRATGNPSPKGRCQECWT